ncbi:Camphor resistance CrcB family protein [Hirschfeldia incana]|nr:Camphor resistance CrcB family protein [Hirschfeldia incana]
MDSGKSHEEPIFPTMSSFSREASAGTFLPVSRSLPLTFNNDAADSDSVSEAGDTGDRSLQRRHSTGATLSPLNSASVTKPFPADITKCPLPTEFLLSPEGKEEEPVLPKSLEYISCLTHLAVFGILGAVTRYMLQKLFGPTVAQVTSDGTILYLDLPANMVGSFLMGWFGVVFKADITRVSEFLAIGLSTGYLGSLTTFSGWNQKMLDLSADGEWLYAVLGFLFGLFLAAYSIILGVETAKGFRWLLRRRVSSEEKKNSCLKGNTYKRHMMSMVFMLTLLMAFLIVSTTELVKEFDKGTSKAQLWLGCLVAAPGVWIRWFLARLNGRGLGKDGQYLRWVPFGTIIANVAAASVMAALATLKKSVETTTCNTVASGIQFGLLGCLSTVSTFMAEFNAMRESDYPWRAYAYASFTIAVSFAVGTIIYSAPVGL